MQTHTAIPRPPLVIRLADPLARRLLASGMPMGPNTLLTVRGRASGQPRSVGVAIVEIGDRRWIVGAYGDVHWVRNLRAAREAEILVAGKALPVRALEYSAAEAAAWIRGTLTPYIQGLPWARRIVSATFARAILADPESAALDHPVFELHVIT
jgi:deazaflavin-dependent oxidoreductase (nitroreductase family)